MIRTLWSIVLLGWSLSAWGVAGISSQAWMEVSEASGLPIATLYAIGLAESNNPFDKKPEPTAYAIGIGPEKGKQAVQEAEYPETREEAEIILSSLINNGHKNLGIGMFQISMLYNSHLADNLADLFDPEKNLRAAGKVLEWCRDRFSDPRSILSCYNKGRITDIGLAYADRVLGMAEKYGLAFERNLGTGELAYNDDRPKRRPRKASAIRIIDPT